ncbi:MAG: flagellar hook-basal body complex protein FliE [Ruminiclostridium sp.]|nr:flagellar hook-basal body complex protein FliE [Ruminiclostridium sp.]
MAVSLINGINSLAPSRSLFETKETENNSYSKIPFADYLNDALNSVNGLLLESDKISNDFAAGITDNIHAVTIAAEKADTALQFTLQIRNKIMDAYAEIMRMQI